LRRRYFGYPRRRRQWDRAEEAEQREVGEIIRPEIIEAEPIRIIDEQPAASEDMMEEITAADRECRRLQREIRGEEAELERLLAIHAATYSPADRAAIAEQILTARYRVGAIRRRAEVSCPAES